MPKLKNVTEAELSALMERAFDFMQEVADVSDRLSKSYGDNDLKECVNRSSTFSAVARESAQMAVTLLNKARIAEQKREIEAQTRELSRLKATR